MITPCYRENVGRLSYGRTFVYNKVNREKGLTENDIEGFKGRSIWNY